MKVMLFGPWTGEFSYEIQWWIPECRSIALNNNDYYKIAIGYEGRKLLYSDFIDEYVSYPDVIKKSLTFPDCWAQRITNNPRILQIPDQVLGFVQHTIQQLNCERVIVHMPDQSLINRRFENNPPGMFKQYGESEIGKRLCTDILKNFIHTDIICINPKLRIRHDSYDHETLDINVWNHIIEFLIRNEKSVINMYIPDNPGTYDLSKFELQYPNNFKQVNLNSKYSLDIQISLLKNTKGSIYGSSGSAVLPIFCNTPMLAIQTKESGWRLNFEWQRKLTNNHKNIIIYNDKDISSYKNITPEDIDIYLKQFINMLRNE